MSALRREEGQIHHDYKPHLIGTVRLAEEGWFQVWGATGVSPCIRTSNRVMIALGESIVEITLEGMAALQGIPLHELPPNRAAARIAVGNAINRTMMTFVMTAVSLYIHHYLVHCKGVQDINEPTTTAVDALDQEPMEVTEEDDEAEAMQTTAPQGSDRSITKWEGYEYDSLLRRTSIMKSAEKEAATTMTIDEPMQASARSTNTSTGWRCYHPNNHHSQDAAQTTAARAKAQKQHPENEHVNRVGEQWHAQFRRIAREKGVTDENGPAGQDALAERLAGAADARTEDAHGRSRGRMRRCGIRASGAAGYQRRSVHRNGEICGDKFM